MQALDQLSREALVALVRDLQSRLDAQALTVLDNNGIPAQRKLAQSDERLRRGAPLDQMLGAVLDSSDDLIVSRGLDGTVLSWNRGAERVLGWRADEIVGRSYLLFVPDERRSEVERITRIATAGHRISRLETIRRHRDGRAVQLSLTISPLRDSEGRIVGVAAIGRDVTLQRDGQRALRESEARFRSLVEASAHAVWITNAQGEVEAEIPSWQAYTGLTFEQARGQGWLRAVHPEDRVVTAEKWRQACESGSSYNAEFRVRRHDGAWRHMHAHAVPVRNEDGSIREWVGMNTDVTERREAEAARALLAAVADSSQDAIISHDMEGTILSWNRGAEEIFGYRPEEAIGRDYRLLTPSTTPEQTRALAQRLMHGERIAPFEVLSRHRDGREIPVSVSLAALCNEAGRVVGVTAVARDITEPRLAAQALRESEQQLESILNNAAEAVIVVAADGSIERFNLAAQRMFGYSGEEARKLNLRRLTVELAFDDAAAGGDERPAAWIGPLMGGRREVTGRRKDGTIFPLELSLSEIGMAPRPPRFTAVVRDITDRKSWENRIYTLAYTDSLTGLPNRLLLRDRLEHAIAAAQRNRTQVGVLFFDLDHFKAINDSYGHHMGDELLREIASRTTGCVREIDTVCRLGGDEFVLVLPELHDAADAGAVARKLLAALSQPYRIDGHELCITPTLGISVYPKDGTDADTLLRNADTAMYHAKESGKNDFRFYEVRREV
jgi:diguanylate cyclase (GGDEF)-like protein/PAS domain S-box-containing protein